MSRNNLNSTGEVSTYLDLADTDYTYDGKAGYIPTVNDNEEGLELKPISNIPQLPLYYYQFGTCNWKVYGQPQLLLNTTYKIFKVGYLVTWQFYGPGGTLGDLPAGEYIALDQNFLASIDPLLRPSNNISQNHTWNYLPLIADNEIGDTYAESGHKLVYDGSDNSMRWRNSKTADGTWQNNRNFTIRSFSISYLTNSPEVPEQII